MQFFETTIAEEEFLKMYRNFYFLINHDFHGTDFSIGGCREPGIAFKNHITEIEVKIHWSESGYLDVQIIKLKRFGDIGFSVRNYYKSFNANYMFELTGSENILKANSLFIQKYLLPVINGKMWIDELLKKKGIANNNNK